MKIDGTIKSLLQGVSQQPARIRLDGQHEVQENFSSDPVDGLKRRPPLDFVSKLYAVSPNTKFNKLDLDGATYIMASNNGVVRIFDLNGIEQTVTFGTDALLYFDGSDIVTSDIENTAYVLNKSKVTAMKTDYKAYLNKGHNLVYLLGGQYGRRYEVTIKWNGQTQTIVYATPDGGSAADALKISTDNIAQELQNAFNVNSTLTANFTLAKKSDVLYFKHNVDGTDVFITVSDGDGGANIFAVNQEITDEGDLPRYAPKGFVIKVAGDSSSGSDDWYLEFLPDDLSISLGNGFGEAGKWVESVAPDTEYLIDKSTMPHVITRDSNGVFLIEQGDWSGRQVGDYNSNEDPSFIGKPLNDIGSFQGRLVVLSGESVVMSRTNKYLDFWLQSATTLVDSDPIDIKSTAKGVSVNMLSMIPHNRDLVIYSENAQFIIFGRNSLTSENASIVQTTTFEANVDAAPVSAGKNVFFAIDYGNYTGIREFFTEGAGDIDNSEPITYHVSKYMTGTVREMVGTSNFNLLLVRTTSNDNTVYAYEYLWKNTELVQSSWKKYIFPDNIELMVFNKSSVFIVLNNGTDYILTEFNLDTLEDNGLTYQVKLDYKVTVTGVNTTFNNPLYGIVNDDAIVIVQGNNCPYTGLTVKPASVGSTIELTEDMLGGDVILGIPYTSKFVPTRLFIKDRNNDVIDGVKLKVRDYSINFENSGDFRVRLNSKYRAGHELKYSGFIVGSPDVKLGQPAINTGVFKFPFREDADKAELEIITDSHLPCNILSINWSGQYNKRGSRI